MIGSLSMCACGVPLSSHQAASSYSWSSPPSRSFSLVGSEYTEWDWYSGRPLILYAKPDLRARLETFLAEQDLVGRLWDELVGSLKLPRIHWWKCFITRQQNGEFLGEVAIDNVPQPALFERLKALPYPEGGLFMIRQFSAVRPTDAHEAERPADLVRQDG